MRKTIDRNAVLMRARELRRRQTLPEGLLWQALRLRPEGLKFRRQHPIGRYILDFYCAAARLAIEVDGAIHGMEENPAHDLKRDAWLREQDVEVIRFAAADVMNDLDSVVRSIIRIASSRLPLHHASHGPPPH